MNYDSFLLSIHPAAVGDYLQVRSEKDRPTAAVKEPYTVVDRVAVIRARGIVEKYPFDGSLSTISLKRAVRTAAAAKSIDAIMLAFDSPGGGVDGLQEAADVIYEARSVKPVVAQVDGMATSAAYWLASQAHRIHAGRGDQVGSIGVRMVIYDYSEMFKKDGVEPVVIDTGAFKSAGIPGTAITDEQRADFQRIVDFYYAEFLDAIKRGRGMADETLKPLADGRVFTGVEAAANGLIDGVQIFDETLRGIVGWVITERARSRLAVHDLNRRLNDNIDAEPSC